MSNFTKEQEQDIMQMYIEEKDIEKIMEKYDCEEHDIRVVLKEQQVDRQYNKFSEELYNRIYYLYQSGKTQKAIEYDVLVYCTSLKKILTRANIPMRSSSDANRRYKRNQHYFDEIDTPNKAYILGMLYADGCNHVEHNSITICLQEQDKAILEAIKQELEYEGPLRFDPLHEKNPNHQNQYVLCINDEYMSARLVELGVVNAKSLILTFPDFLPDDLIRHFVRGYFDGDGCVYYDEKRSKCQTVTVGTTNFCHSLSDILHDMEIKNSIKHRPCYKPATSVLQTCGNKSSYQFLSWIYDDAEMKLERKYQKYLSFVEKYKG